MPLTRPVCQKSYLLIRSLPKAPIALTKLSRLMQGFIHPGEWWSVTLKITTVIPTRQRDMSRTRFNMKRTTTAKTIQGAHATTSAVALIDVDARRRERVEKLAPARFRPEIKYT